MNSFTTGNQIDHAIVAHSSGSFVVVWSSAGQDGNFAGIFAQRFDATANAQRSEFRVNSTITGGQYVPSVAMAPTGDFVIVWSGPDGSLRGIFAQRYNSMGVAVGAEFVVNEYTMGYQGHPSVAFDASGNFGVTWEGYDDGSQSGILARRYDFEGVPLGSQFVVNTFTSGQQTAPAIVSTAPDAFVVLWASRGQDGSGAGVFGQRFDLAGNLLGGEFQVNTYTPGYQDMSAIAADGAGNFVAAWRSRYQDGDGHGVYAQRYDAAGAPFGAEFRINTYTTDDQVDPSVSFDADGQFVVAWQSNLQDGSNWGLFGQTFGSAGAPVGPEFQITTHTTGPQIQAAVASRPGGTFVVAWASNGPSGMSQDGSAYGVFGRIFQHDLIFADGFQ